MSRRSMQQKLGTTRGSPRRSRTAKASRISRKVGEIAMCPRVGRMGLISVDGPGQKNPDRSESPGAESNPTPRRCAEGSSARHRTGLPNSTNRCTKGRRKPCDHRRMPGAGLSDGHTGKALPDMPAFQPYWGKPAVRNDRGDGGNVGIMRSPLRATVLPDSGGRSAMVVPTATATRRDKMKTQIRGHDLRDGTILRNPEGRGLRTADEFYHFSPTTAGVTRRCVFFPRLCV
jgi:hypothetical protein